MYSIMANIDTLAFENLKTNLEDLCFFIEQIKRMTGVLNKVDVIVLNFIAMISGHSCNQIENDNHDCDNEILINSLLKLGRFAHKFSKLNVIFFNETKRFIKNITDVIEKDELMDNTIISFLIILISSCIKFNTLNDKDINEKMFDSVFNQFVEVTKQIDYHKNKKEYSDIKELSIDDFLNSSFDGTNTIVEFESDSKNDELSDELSDVEEIVSYGDIDQLRETDFLNSLFDENNTCDDEYDYVKIHNLV